MEKKKTKKFNFGTIELTMENNGYPRGLVLLRDLTEKEALYVFDKLLGYDKNLWLDDCSDAEERRDFKKRVTEDINGMLKGDIEEQWFNGEYAPDCYDEAIPAMLFLPIVAYLKKKGIIK